MRRLILGAFALMLIAALAMVGNSQSHAQGDATPASTGEATVAPSYAGKVNAPEFPSGLDWINVPRPLTMKDLRGKVVLLDFWTYGCINCIHIIPDLKRLEEEFANKLQVIGVHSAKFTNEGSTENIREIVQRYEIDHPVVNDFQFDIWNLYGVQAWPTIMVIDPLGKVVGYYSGEGVYNAMEPALKTMIAQDEAQGLIDTTPIQTAPELAKRADSPLDFPGKVLADAAGNRLFISDTNHNRIVVADLNTYQIQAVIGNNAEGLKDGDFTTAEFHHPQGVAVNGDDLYVADTENHAIRLVDLKAQTVRTVAGTGEQTQTRSTGGPAQQTALNSPWDLIVLDGKVYIAMAGPHQLWVYDPAAQTVQPYAGSGAEGLEDGPLADAQLAQPSAIATDGKTIYFNDPESSSVRMIVDGNVKTIVGTGLFDFGDTDGAGDQVRLQHALGLTVGPDGKLYIADTYNSKIKVIDPATRESKTVFGTGPGPAKDGSDARFYEPGGISYANGKLYIADTNNNLIRVADLNTKTVSTVQFPNPDALKVSPSGPVVAQDVPDSDYTGKIIQANPVEAAPGAGKIVLNILLPKGYAFNDQAPFVMHVNQADGIVSVAPADNDYSKVIPDMPITMPATLKAGQTTLKVDADIFYCEEVNKSLCFPARVRLVMPVTVKDGAASTTIAVDYTVVPPKSPSNTLGQ